jgi:hypothetical protein
VSKKPVSAGSPKEGAAWKVGLGAQADPIPLSNAAHILAKELIKRGSASGRRNTRLRLPKAGEEVHPSVTARTATGPDD